MLQMHNVNSLTTILYISRTNIQHAVFAAKKDISHMLVALKHKKIILKDLHSPSLNHNHYHITSIRPQGNHQVLMAHPAHVGATITILVPLITGMSPHHLSF